MEEQKRQSTYGSPPAKPVRVTQDGTVTIWDDMTMTRRPIASKGFQRPPAEKPAARAKRKR